MFTRLVVAAVAVLGASALKLEGKCPTINAYTKQMTNTKRNTRYMTLKVDPIPGSTGFEVLWFHVVGKKMSKMAGPGEFAYGGYKNTK